jgi:NADPH:quinone reductase-like Zn-dependent oxidoreductase
MRAAVYDRGCSEGIKVVANRPFPSPAKGALLVRVKACGVNPVDAKGVIGDKLPTALRGFARRLVDGKIAGFDLSGVVEHAPPGCGFAVGDEVFGAVPPFRGAMAELVSVPLDQVAAKPKSLTHEQAAALVLPGVTVTQLLDQHGFTAGQHALVIGASGGVGHLAVQILRARGAALVAGVCSEKNVEFCESLGAHRVATYDGVNAPKGDHDGLIEALRSIVAETGQPFDLVIDTVTSHDSRDAGHAYEDRLREAGDVLANPSRSFRGQSGSNRCSGVKISSKNEKNIDPRNYVTVGGGTFEWVLASLKRVFRVNFFRKGHELFWIRFPGCGKELRALAALADDASAKSFERADGERRKEKSLKQIAPAVAATHPLTSEGVRAAFATLHSRRTVGKVVVVP